MFPFASFVFTLAVAFTAMAFLDPYGLVARFGIWRMIAIVFALLNLKNIPFAWHLRVLTGFVTHIFLNPPYNPSPSMLFQPVITKTRNSLMDCDWNIHKSNSTYFTDLDVARSHIGSMLSGRGLGKAGRDLVDHKGRLGIMLGGVHCSFRHEIKPLQGFEIWTRVLAWDKKWLYLISHIVEKGAVQPKGFSLQPWRKSKNAEQKRRPGAALRVGQDANTTERSSKSPAPKIFASSIAKYVYKKGRLTIPPARVLEGSGFLPPKPSNVNTPLESSTPSDLPDSTSHEPVLAAAIHDLSSTPTNDVINASLKPHNSDNDNWDWQRVEDERVRGMKIAEMFNGLDALNEEFRGADDMALGIYTDPC